MTSTTFAIEGYRTVKTLGVVRGITVRSRSIIGNFAGAIQTIFGGKIPIYIQLCEKARDEAFQQMLQHAEAIGGNAVIGVRYDANEVMSGVTEVSAMARRPWSKARRRRCGSAGYAKSQMTARVQKR